MGQSGQRRWLLTLGGTHDHPVIQLLLGEPYVLLQLPCRTLLASLHPWNVFRRCGYQEAPRAPSSLSSPHSDPGWQPPWFVMLLCTSAS